MTPQWLWWLAIASIVLGSIGGGLEKAFAPEPGKPARWPYRLGAFLASLGTDIVSLRKMGGGS